MLLGLSKKGIEKYTSKIPGDIRIEEFQKIVLLRTAHILRSTLSIKYFTGLMTATGSRDELGTIREKSSTSKIIIIIITIIIITSNTSLAGPREARGCDNIFYWLGGGGGGV